MGTSYTAFVVENWHVIIARDRMTKVIDYSDVIPVPSSLFSLWNQKLAVSGHTFPCGERIFHQYCCHGFCSVYWMLRGGSLLAYIKLEATFEEYPL